MVERKLLEYGFIRRGVHAHAVAGPLVKAQLERGEVFRRVQIDRGIRHRHSDQSEAVALEDDAGALVAPQLRQLAEAYARKNRRHPDVAFIHRGGDDAFLFFPCADQPLQVVERDRDLVAQHDHYGVAGGWQCRQAAAQGRCHSFFPLAIDDHGGGRMAQQPRQVLRVRAGHYGHCAARHGDAVRDHPVQHGPPAELNQLFRLAQPSRRARC